MSAALGLLLAISVSAGGRLPDAIPSHVPDSLRLAAFEFLLISSPQYVAESFQVTIIAKDQYGANFPYSGNALLSTTKGPYVFPNVVSFTLGVSQPRVIVTLAESLALRCFTDSATGTGNVFEVLPGAPRRLVAVLPGEQLAPGQEGGRSGLPVGHAAGDTFAFDVFLTDIWYNPISLRDDSVYFGSTDQFGSLPAGGKLSNGSASFVAGLRTAGRHRLYTMPALGSSLRTDTSSLFDVLPGAFAKLLLVAPGETLLPGDTSTWDWDTPGKTGRKPAPQFLRDQFPVTVYACDRCWNRVVGPGDTVSLRSDFSVNFGPPMTELRDSALFTVQFNNPGSNQNLWVLNQTTSEVSYKTHIDIKARGAQLEVSWPDTVRAGETAYISIRVKDGNGDPITAALTQATVVSKKSHGVMIDQAMLTDTLGYTMARFLCAKPLTSEHDSVLIASGIADTVIDIYVTHLTDSMIAYPNPFGFNRDRAQISYYLQRSAPIVFTIYDGFGNEVWTRNFRQNEYGAKSGDNTIFWDGTDSKGRRVANGIYIIQIVSKVHTGIENKITYRLGVVW